MWDGVGLRERCGRHGDMVKGQDGMRVNDQSIHRNGVEAFI